MEVKERTKMPEIFISPELSERALSEGKVLILYPTLKFSCFIVKRFRAELGNPPGEGLHLKVGDLDVYVLFRTIGTKFCGGEKGFEDFEFPVKEPERFIPRWIKVNPDLGGDFGYL